MLLASHERVALIYVAILWRVVRLMSRVGTASHAKGTNMRSIRIASAQLGPRQKDNSRHSVVSRVTDLMNEAKGQGADLMVYPELALTTFFPRRPYEP
jgi:hypothetical protein